MGNFPVVDESSYSANFHLKDLRRAFNQDRSMLVSTQAQLLFNVIKGRTHFGYFFDEIAYRFRNSTHCELLFDDFFHKMLIEIFFAKPTK